MFDMLSTSLRNRLLVAFISIGFLPFILFLVYTLILSETKIVDKLISEQQHKAALVKKRINSHLLSLTKEVSFLSRLDLMDDILVEDIDKRVSRLLSQKKEDYGLNLEFMVINKHSKVISSSDKMMLSKPTKITQHMPYEAGNLIVDKTLYIYCKIYASFEKNKELGTLVLAYDLSNLKQYISHTDHIHSYIMNPKNGLSIGNKLSFEISPQIQKNSLSQDNYLIVYQQMDTYLEAWYIVYAVKKDLALAFLYDFIRFMLYLSPAILLLVVYLALRYTRHIVKPIQSLTEVTDSIIHSKDYSRPLHTSSKDEIGRLTDAFNTLLRTTNKALKRLEEENKIRLRRFVQLIEVFNTIIRTKDEEECIQTSIEQIRRLTQHKDIRFTKEQSDASKGIILHVNDFEKDEKIYFGSIVLDLKLLQDKNEKSFYTSISRMVMLQLDKIRLIKTTQSASAAKSSFISNMSHELKTPLNAIIGFSQYMITYEDLNDEQLDIVSNIESSAQYLLEMIYGILDIAKIEAGKMDVTLEDLDILALLKETFAMIEPLAQNKDLDFELVSTEYAQKAFRSDAKILKQIILNLLSNAIKFTDRGSIRLELSNTDEYLLVKIIDTGIGLSQEEIDRLFTDFTQLENSMQKAHKGTGLGLSLSKKLSHLIGGDIWLESEGENCGVIAILKVQYHYEHLSS